MNSKLSCLPHWTSLNYFEARLSFADQAFRVINNGVFIGTIWNIGALLTNSTTIHPWITTLLMARKVAHIYLGYSMYPAIPSRLQSFDDYPHVVDLRTKGYFLKKIMLNKSGVQYEALIMGYADDLHSKKWTLYALKNETLLEDVIKVIVNENSFIKSNALIVSGPCIGDSQQGWPTTYQLGGGLEVGLQFLEQEIQAEKIAIKASGLMAACLAEAILQHSFDDAVAKKIQYLVIWDRSVSRLNQWIEQRKGKLFSYLALCVGMELSPVKAVQKLKDYHIKQIIIQHSSQDGEGTDSVIEDKSSLAYALDQDEEIQFLTSASLLHTAPLLTGLLEKYQTALGNFFENVS